MTVTTRRKRHRRRKANPHNPWAFRRPRAKTTPVMTWLRGRTFQEVYGYAKVVDGRRGARPSYTIPQYQHRRNSRRWVKKLANYRYVAHFNGQATYYYFGDPEARQTLVMLDIDVQKSLGRGTTQGAI